MQSDVINKILEKIKIDPAAKTIEGERRVITVRQILPISNNFFIPLSSPS